MKTSGGTVYDPHRHRYYYTDPYEGTEWYMDYQDYKCGRTNWKPVEEEFRRKEKGMNYSAAVTLITDDVKMIGVKFKTTSGWSKEYVYKSAYEVEEGALVLIHNQGAEDDIGERPSGFGVAQVTNLDPEVNYDDPNKKYKWIAQVVDLTTYNSNLEREAEMLEKVRGADKRSKREQLRDSLLASIDADERKAITF